MILAGGSGARLWPVSRANSPKQIQPFVDNDTLLQKTYRRLRSAFAPGDIYVVTGASQAAEVGAQLPELPDGHVIAEPARRDTAAAIGLAAVHIAHAHPEEVLITVHSDHHIADEAEYVRVLKQAATAAQRMPEHGVLVGSKPTYPETGYGYIKMDSEAFVLDSDEVFHVAQFIEKPDAQRANEYVKKWGYLWNPGYFIWRVDTLLAQYQALLPDMHARLQAIGAALGTPEQAAVLEREFAAIEPVAIDYGIMERAKNLLVIPADFGFTDIGHWRAIKDILGDGTANVTKGLAVCVDSANNLVYNFTHKPVALAGVHNMVVVATDDAVLVCDPAAAQSVKKVVEELKKRGLETFV